MILAKNHLAALPPCPPCFFLQNSNIFLFFFFGTVPDSGSLLQNQCKSGQWNIMISYYILCITTQFDNFTELFCFYKYMIENLITNVVRCRQLPRKRRQTKKTTQTTQMDIQGDFNLFINNLNTGSPSYQKGCFFHKRPSKRQVCIFLVNYALVMWYLILLDIHRGSKLTLHLLHAPLAGSPGVGSVVVFLDKQIQGNIPGGMQRKRKIPFRVILYIQVYNSINGTIITNPIIIINIILESNRRNHISYYIRYLDLKGWFEILVWWKFGVKRAFCEKYTMFVIYSYNI